MNNLLKPSDFDCFPCSSCTCDSDTEEVALNIIRLLIQTGNKWRIISWDEYSIYHPDDSIYDFNRVIGFCTSAKRARTFCERWEIIASHTYSYARYVVNV